MGRMTVQIPRDRLAVGVLLTVALVTVARLFCAVNAELLPEEAYYWTYWKHPALSYFDHPPMVAWIIGLGTAVFGDTELGVRVGTIALSVGSSVLVFLLGKLWFDRRVGLWSLLLFSVLPIFVGTGLFAFPDGPLIFFWLLTMYAVAKALRGGNRYWLLAGAAFGAALLSKYPAIMLAPSLLLFLLLSRKHRVWLRRPEPWLAVFIALMVFSPVIIWNAQHDWASFRFQVGRTEKSPKMLWDMAMFWVMQIGVLTPVLFALFCIAIGRAVKRGWFQHDDKWAFALAFFLPIFLLFLKSSFKLDIHINWTAPAYLSLLCAAAAVFVELMERGKHPRWWRAAGILTVGSCVAVMLVAISSLVWGVPHRLTYHHAGGWRDLGRQIESAEEDLQKRTGQPPFTIGLDKYFLAAELGFYTGEPQDAVNTYALGKQGLGFRYWTDLTKLEGHPAVAVLNKVTDDSLAQLKDDFERTDEPRRIEVAAGANRSRTFYVVNCYGFRGHADDQLP